MARPRAGLGIRRLSCQTDGEPVTTSTLVATDVSKSYDGVQALSGVSLVLPLGTILGLIGPNGSGKTTFLNCISGVTKPTGGLVRVDDVDTTGAPPHRIARLGVARTFQTVRLFKTLTVQENVEVGLVGTSRSRAGWRTRGRAASRLLKEFQLSSLASRLASTLPYGLQRRVEIARAVAAGPRYLLLDEPAAGMNDQESDELLDLLGQVGRTDARGLLVIDHDLRLIMRLCDRIHVLNRGETLAEGDPASVRADQRVVDAYLGSSATSASGSLGSAGNEETAE
jgi:ABC-type branched-subunit amino acid transport system ATPase component